MQLSPCKARQASLTVRYEIEKGLRALHASMARLRLLVQYIDCYAQGNTYKCKYMHAKVQIHYMQMQKCS